MKWKTTSLWGEMEDDLKLFGNGRRPQHFQKWKTTSNFSEMEDDLNLLDMEDNINLLYLEMEDDLNFFGNGRRHQFTVNGR